MRFFAKKGLSTRLSASIISGATIIFILLFIFNYYKSSTIIEKKVEENIDQISQKVEIKIESFFKNIEKQTQQARIFAESKNYSKEELLNYLRRYVEINDNIYGSTFSLEPFIIDNNTEDFAPYFFKKNEEIQFVELSDNYKYRQAIWYTTPQNTGTACWQEPYFDEGGGNIFMTTYSVPIFRNNKQFIGVVTSDVSLEWLKSFINSIQIYKSGYGFIISGDGNIIAHPFASFIKDTSLFLLAKKLNNQKLEELGKEMISRKTGRMELLCPWTNQEGIVNYTRLSIQNWSIALFYPKKELTAEINELSTFLILFGIIGAFALFILILTISKAITKPLNIAASTNELIANGELAKASDYLNKSSSQKFISEINRKDIKNEILRFFHALRLMSERLLTLLGKVQYSSNKVKNSANQIKLSSQELEATVNEQAATTNQFAKSIKDIARTSSELAYTMQDVSYSINQTSKSAKSGYDKLYKMKDKMDDFSGATKSFATKLTIITEKTNKITSIVSTINKISDQTNLLSLNASIEAEKAGEYGKGFSVVAKEISRLADQTAIATRDIELMVKEMQSSVSSGVMEMDKFYQEVNNSISEVISIISLMRNIIEDVQNLKPSFDSVASGMENHNEITNQIYESIEQLNFTIEHTRNSLIDFKSATYQLDEVINELQEEISNFKL